MWFIASLGTPHASQIGVPCARVLEVLEVREE